ERQATIDALNASTSWQSTAPLQYLKRLSARLVHSAMPVPQQAGHDKSVLRYQRAPARLERNQYYRSSFRTIVHLAKLLNAHNAAKAITYMRAGQFRLLCARTRDLMMARISVVNSASYSAPRDRAYLTSHPELIPGPKPPLDASVSVVIPTYNAGLEF